MLEPILCIKRMWDHGLFDCCTTDLGFCFYACTCPCLAYKSNASAWYKVLAMPDDSCGDCCLCSMLACCGMSMFLTAKKRTNIRANQQIPGSYVDDLATHCCCFSCAITQEHDQANRILRDRRGEQWKAQQAANAPPAYQPPPAYMQ